MTFVIRKFDPQGFGAALRAMRKASNTTLSELEAKTKIRRCYLEAFELEEFDKLPDPIYSRNFLKRYVCALGGDETYFLQWFNECSGRCDFLKGRNVPTQQTRIKTLFSLGRMIKIGVVSLCVMASVGYIGWQLQGLLAAPEILVFEPMDGYVTDEAQLAINGRTDQQVNITINGTRVLLNQDGSFDTNIHLERGLNIIRIEGAKRYSKEAKIYRRVILEQSQQLGRAN